jgi:hypothetical protein
MQKISIRVNRIVQSKVQISAKRHVAPLEHIILIPSKQYMLLHFSAASLVKKQH